MPTFCRHNRFVADCPICSKGTVLDPNRRVEPRERSKGKRRSAPAASATRVARGPYASAGPYDGAELRLERVPGGLRLAVWRGGQIDRVAPVLPAADLPALLTEAVQKELLDSPARGGELPAEPGIAGTSPGRAGDLHDELRVEILDDGRVRIARWVNRPGRGWELQEAPVMLPPKRFGEALAAAARSSGPVA